MNKKARNLERVTGLKPTETHTIHPELLRRRVRVLVVGCGGTGSATAGGLPYLHQAPVANGHPEGLHVTLRGIPSLLQNELELSKKLETALKGTRKVAPASP